MWFSGHGGHSNTQPRAHGQKETQRTCLDEKQRRAVLDATTRIEELGLAEDAATGERRGTGAAVRFTVSKQASERNEEESA